MKRYFLLVFAYLISNFSAVGQVNLQTGSATYSIPVFNYQDNISRLSIPVSINYSSGYGLRVDEVATDVGQGWGLMAGGRIIRQQVGEPDDQYELQGGVLDIRKYPAGYLFSNENAENGVPVDYGKYPVFPTQNVLYKQHNKFSADRELDYFFLNLSGVNATFVLKKGTTEGVFIGNNLMKVRFELAAGTTQNLDAATGFSNQKARTVITAFIVTDENGIEYRFDKKAFTRILKTIPTDGSFQNANKAPKKIKKHGVYYEANMPDNNAINPYIVNEWHLTSVTDKLVSGRSIQLNYVYRNMDIWMGVEANIVNAKKDYAKLTARRAIVNVPVALNILCPNQYQINFNYDTTHRYDLPGSFALQGIEVTYRGRFVQKHKFDQSYIILSRYGIPKNMLECFSSRLYLRRVTKLTADLKDIEKPYVFDYYMGGTNNVDFVPPPFFIAKDIWGYYNGFRSIVGNDAFLPKAMVKENAIRLGRLMNEEMRRRSGGNELTRYSIVRRICFDDFHETGIKANYARNGLLRSVQAPTGAQVVYEYSQNMASYFGEVVSERTVGGVHVSKTITYDGGYSNDCQSDGIQKSYNYKLENGLSSLWGVERPLNSLSSITRYRPFSKKYRFPFSCGYRYQYPGVLQAEYTNHINGYQKIMNNPFIKVFSVLSEIYSIYATIQTTLLLASGVTLKASAIVAAALHVLWMIFDFIYSCFAQDDWKTFHTTNKYNADLNSINPLPLLYKRVEVIEVNSSNGKVVYDFTSNDDYDIWIKENPVMVRQQRFAPWAYGLIKKITFFDQSNKVVKSQANYYNLKSNCNSKNGVTNNCNPSKIPLELPSCNVFILSATAERSNIWSNTSFSNPTLSEFYTTTNKDGLRVILYDLYTGRAELDSVVERVFDMNNETSFFEKKMSYKYHHSNYQPIEIEEISNSGIATRRNIFYQTYINGNIQHEQSINRLKQANIFTTPVVILTSVCNTGKDFVYQFGASNYLDSYWEQTEYLTLSNGLVKPSIVKARRTARPVGDISIIPEIITDRFIYDQDGQLLGVSDEGNRIFTQLLDYDKQFVTAQIINSNPDPESGDRVAYTSFETESNAGGWEYQQHSVQHNPVTGYKSYSLSTSNTVATVGSSFPTHNMMRLSLWATSPNIIITGVSYGAAPVKTGPVLNGYTYYEFEVQPSGGKIIISGNTQIDELRLYPKKSRMTTTAYDPLFGKITECDQNNRITYYEYDTRGRLLLVKDDVGDIIKMYQYNEKQQIQTCPAVYTNNAVYALYQKNNCGDSFVGDFVEYFVPAGRYSSTISQEVADEMANTEAMNGGQTMANQTATCLPLYFNQQRSETFTKQDCDTTNGYSGTAYTYTVAANAYYSLISLEDANEQADDEISANGQFFADSLGNCVQHLEPVWEGDENSLRCRTLNDGSSTGETEMRFIDVNPFSSTYSSVFWTIVPENPLNCTGGIVYARLEYDNLTFDFLNNTYADIFIRFYRDSMCTQAISVNNQNFNVGHSWEVIQQPSGNVRQFERSFYINATGTHYIIGYNVLLTYLDSDYDPFTEVFNSTYTSHFYFLRPGNNYIIRF